MGNEITVIARLPHGAFGDWRDIPSSHDDVYTKQFNIKSIKRALAYANKTSQAYHEGHGNCAMSSVRIQIGETIYSRGWVSDVLGWANGYDITDAAEKINTVADFVRHSNKLSAVREQVNREMDAQYAAEEAYILSQPEDAYIHPETLREIGFRAAEVVRA